MSDEFWTATFCVECGPSVKVDEDGCCASCGGAATGPYAEKYRELEAEVERLKQWERVAIANKETAQRQEERWVEYKGKWEAAEAKLAKIEEGYREAIEDIEGWGAYASEYFAEKHDLAGCVDRHKAILRGANEDE